MQRAHLCFVILVGSAGLAWAAETIRPNPADGELVVNDFTQLQSTSLNALGHFVATANEMKVTFSKDNDPRAVLTPKTTGSFLYSFLRQPGQCFDASNFDYISLELKAEKDQTIQVGFSSNPNHCDEAAESVMRYSLGRIVYKAGGQERSVADLRISEIPGDALKTNINAIMVGGLLSPIDIYSIKLKSSSSKNVNESTIVRVPISDQGTSAPAPEDVVQSETESGKASTLVVENFETDNKYENILKGTHGSDDTMPEETYTAAQGVFLTSKDASSYWFTVIPCTDSMTFKHYDMILLDIAGPKGGDFNIKIKTQVQCEADFKLFNFKASDLLKVKLDGMLQRIAIPFDMMTGFDKKIHTIQTVILGDFRNEGEDHAGATPMNLNVKYVALSGTNSNGNEDDDKKQERIAAKEKENPIQYDSIQERVDSYNGACQSTISILAIVSAALLLVL